jgi:hypothetical protein
VLITAGPNSGRGGLLSHQDFVDRTLEIIFIPIAMNLTLSSLA